MSATGGAATGAVAALAGRIHTAVGHAMLDVCSTCAANQPVLIVRCGWMLTTIAPTGRNSTCGVCAAPFGTVAAAAVIVSESAYQFTDIAAGGVLTVNKYDTAALVDAFAGAPAAVAELAADVADGLTHGRLPDSDTLAALGLDWIR